MCTQCNPKINATGFDYEISYVIKRCEEDCELTFSLFYSEELGCSDHCPNSARYYIALENYCLEQCP